MNADDFYLILITEILMFCCHHRKNMNSFSVDDDPTLSDKCLAFRSNVMMRSLFFNHWEERGERESEMIWRNLKKQRPKKQWNNQQWNFILFTIYAHHHEPDDEAVNITTVYQCNFVIISVTSWLLLLLLYFINGFIPNTSLLHLPSGHKVEHIRWVHTN